MKVGKLIVGALVFSTLVISCEHGNTSSKSSVAYPYYDTIKVGLQADSGENKYALIEVAFKHLSKDTEVFAGSSTLTIGNQKWHVVSYLKPLPR